jgi:hypothetical protein
MSVEKRPAFEPPSVLVERVAPPPDMRRPSATMFGTLLVLLRVLAGVAWLLSLALQWDRVLVDDLGLEIEPGTLDAEGMNALLVVILVIGGIVLAIDLVLGVLVYFGSNAARLAVMVLATLSITVAAIDYFGGGEDITIRTTLFTLSLDILVLLALSSRAARAYARRPRPTRRGRHSGPEDR